MSYYIEVPKEYGEELITFLNKEFISVADKLCEKKDSCVIEKADFYGCGLEEIMMMSIAIFLNYDIDSYPILENYLILLINKFSASEKKCIKIKKDNFELEAEGFDANEVLSFIKEIKK